MQQHPQFGAQVLIDDGQEVKVDLAARGAEADEAAHIAEEMQRVAVMRYQNAGRAP